MEGAFRFSSQDWINEDSYVDVSRSCTSDVLIGMPFPAIRSVLGILLIGFVPSVDFTSFSNSLSIFRAEIVEIDLLPLLSLDGASAFV